MFAAARRHQEEVEEGKAAPFLLFPEVAEYGLSTIDAGESLPHPQALHPTLPRQWLVLGGQELDRVAVVWAGQGVCPPVQPSGLDLHAWPAALLPICAAIGS